MQPNNFPAPFPAAALPDLWEQQVARTPQAAAIISRQECLTYSAFDARVRELAAHLSSLGVRAGVRVGVSLSSSPRLIVTLAAILKAGASFVPLDAAAPPARLRRILDDAEAGLVIEDHPSDGLKTAHPHLLTRTGATPGESGAREAYVVFTSGSTGQPKGVLRSHGAIASRLAWASYGPGDVLCHNMPITGGLAQERLFIPLMQGASLAVIPEAAYADPVAMAGEVEALGVTELTLVPRVLSALLHLGYKERERLRSLRTIMVGGAPLTAELARAITATFPEVTLINTYGSTEMGSVIRGVAESGGSTVPLGRPLPNVSAFVLDEFERPAAVGAIGELCISAPSLASGYLNQPRLTAQRFVNNKFGEGILYRTGDRARLLPSGEIQLGGRTDRQVKVRGFTVELEEIESTLERMDGVREAAVVCAPAGADARLRAYVAGELDEVSLPKLRSQLATLLPNHMIPSAIAVLDRLPRGFNGKVELRLLPEIACLRPELDYPYVAPRDAGEAEVVRIWERVLGIGGIGVNDHFAHLGGDSLLAVRMLVELEEHTGIAMPAAEFALLGTPAAIAGRFR